MNGLNKKKAKICRFDIVNLSDLEAGDRFHFPKMKSVVYTFLKYSEIEKGWIFKSDNSIKESIKKTDLPVVFLRKTK